jgi:hypothetical protein
MKDQTWFSVVAIAAAIAVLVFGGVAVVISAAPAPATSPSNGTPGVDYLYLTISFNPVNGLDQYFPANFSVPAHQLVVVTITSYDNGTNAPPASATTVQGVVGGAASLQSPAGAAPQSYTQLPLTGISHTFSIMQSPYNVNVPIPPSISLSQPIVVSFSLYFNTTGIFTWLCQAPCDPNSMTTPGFMTGALTVD